jgi:hypothetical protein
MHTVEWESHLERHRVLCLCLEVTLGPQPHTGPSHLVTLHPVSLDTI